MISHCLGELKNLLPLPRENRGDGIAALPETCPHADCTTGRGCRAYLGFMLAQEDRRRECEARAWLRRGYTRRVQVDALIAKIAERRGQQSADRLRQDMREQWSRRDEWMEPTR